MARKYRFSIKNRKLMLLALVFISLFTYLGTWQLARAKQKELLLKSYAERTEAKPFEPQELRANADLRFYRLTLTGKFDNEHNLLLDNKIFHGQVGYEVYTPFISAQLVEPILVDRGFVPIGRSRAELPSIPNAESVATITGMLNLPPTYVALGKMHGRDALSYPQVLEYIDLAQLNQLFHANFFPYVLSLQKDEPAALQMEWQIVTMGPERHRGYAVQWFALALTLLILSVVLNRDSSGKK